MTTRVLLLLTGKCEHHGLPSALARTFGGLADVTFDVAGESPPRRRPLRACDLAIAVDDLELANAGRAGDVPQFFRTAVAREVGGPHALTIGELERVAKRCSFHLFSPMVEAYCFGEREAIERAVATAEVRVAPPWSTSGPSLEECATADAGYTDRILAPDLTKQEREDKTLAWRAANRERHPKHYLEFLCRTGPLGYREGKAGVAALEKLAFAQVVERDTPLLRQAFADAVAPSRRIGSVRKSGYGRVSPCRSPGTTRLRRRASH